MNSKTAVIIGAGPAGLTAAYELLTRSDIRPIVIERDPQYVGGISRTVVHNGNRIDLGGHRFFSKSDRVMRWWSHILPVRLPASSSDITYQRSTRSLTQGMETATGGEGDAVFEVRPRKTRIIYRGKFFAYPIELSLDTLLKLGPIKVSNIGVTYLASTLFPIRPERTLEDFFINRFGRELYETFFKSYTEKVWGTPCSAMSAEWGAQRVKGLSIASAVLHALKKLARIGTLSGKGVETSLIEQFLYPPLGPGFLWETVAERIRALGGEIRKGESVVQIATDGSRVTAVTVRSKDGTTKTLPADYVVSTTDVRALVQMLGGHAPASVQSVAEGLQYRAFFTVGLLLERKPTEPDGSPLTDTWMYVHEPGVTVGRIQLFHNWHGRLVADPAHGWVGLEYFCDEGDTLWSTPDEDLIKRATEELERIGIRSGIPVLDAVVVREPKAYPGYFGSYDRFPEVRTYLDSLHNLYPIGRNGMHRYNNQDHSMLTAMAAVDNMVSGRTDKANIWEVNTEQEYHEKK